MYKFGLYYTLIVCSVHWRHRKSIRTNTQQPKRSNLRSVANVPLFRLCLCCFQNITALRIVCLLLIRLCSQISACTKYGTYSRKNPREASCVITQTGLSTWMFMYKMIFNNSARLVEMTLPDALFNLYVEEPDAAIWRITTIRSPYFSCSYASDPLFDMCTSIVADDSPVFIRSEQID